MEVHTSEVKLKNAVGYAFSTALGLNPIGDNRSINGLSTKAEQDLVLRVGDTAVVVLVEAKVSAKNGNCAFAQSCANALSFCQGKLAITDKEDSNCITN